jgi:hypothetical protein
MNPRFRGFGSTAMAERKSLVDDSMESVGTHKKEAKKSSSGGSGNGLKVALIAVCFVVAGVLLAYNFGLIENPFAEKIKPTVHSEEDLKNIDDYKKANEAARKSANPPATGSS